MDDGGGMNKERDWFDRPENRKLLWRLLWAICGLTLVAELFVERHGHFKLGSFSIDGWPVFYAVLGFLACALSIFAAKILGKFLKVREDYYDHDL